MKNLFFILIGLIIFSSCSTPEQLAQKYIKKAIKLDPSVIKNYRLDTLINGIAEGNVTIKTPEVNGELGMFNCDSIKNQLDSMKADKIGKKEVLVRQDSNITVSVTKDEKGNYKIKYIIQPKYINVPVKVPYQVKVNVPGKEIKIEVDKPFYKYIWFWVLSTFLLLESFLLIKNTKPVIYLTDKISGKK